MIQAISRPGPHKLFVRRACWYGALLAGLLCLPGCGQMLSNAKQSFADDLSATMLSFDDPQTVAKAAPAYLLLVSSMIRGEPDNADLLASGARLYSAYASAFVENSDSRKALSRRAFDYARRGFCLQWQPACGVTQQSFDDYQRFLQALPEEQMPSLFLLAQTWAGVIEADSGNWNRVAELPRVRAAIEKILAVDDTWANGRAHLYLAVLDALLPAALGGKPEQAKAHFERAIAISKGQDLMARVLYAERYARLVFDRELHDRQLQAVLQAKVNDDENRLSNMLAKQKARALLASADDYF